MPFIANCSQQQRVKSCHRSGSLRDQRADFAFLTTVNLWQAKCNFNFFLKFSRLGKGKIKKFWIINIALCLSGFYYNCRRPLNEAARQLFFLAARQVYELSEAIWYHASCDRAKHCVKLPLLILYLMTRSYLTTENWVEWKSTSDSSSHIHLEKTFCFFNLKFMLSLFN